MKNITRLQERFQTQLKKVEATIPPWRVGLWKRGRATFYEQGLPNKKAERYRYTPLERIATIFANGWSEAPPKKHPSANLSTTDLPGYHLLLHNGLLQPTPNLPKGISVTPFSKLDHHSKRRVTKPYPSPHPAREDPWEALNTALFTDGIYLNIDKGTQLKQPIFLHHYIDTDHPTILHPRLHYHLEERAQIDLIEITHLQGAGTILQNSVVNITLAQSARLRRHLWSTDLKEKAIYLNHTNVVGGEQSHFWESSTLLGKGFMRHALNISLVEPNAKATLYGGYIGQGRAHIEHSSMIAHQATNTTSDTLYKGIIDGRSTGVFYSSEHVANNAVGTSTSQYHHGWALDDHAHIYARPELFIHREAVACQHGATMERMDSDKLFYLTARGIPQPVAQKILLHAFLQEVINPIPTKALRNHVQQQTSATLHQVG